MKIICKLIVLVLILFVAGCGSDHGDVGNGETPGDPIQTPVAAIQLSAQKSTIMTGESVQISVRLVSSSGQTITGQKTVTFSFNNSVLASIPSPVVISNGVANQVLTAGNIEGSVTLSATVDNVTEQLTLEISDSLPAANIVLTSNPVSITTGGTAVVGARVIDTNGQPMPDGTVVTFVVNNASLGTIVPSATVSGGDGVALATFSASSGTVGNATISATSGSATGTTTINIMGAAAGSIEFVAAEPQIIVIRGSGGLETSLIEFLVKDSNGNPVLGSQSVRLTLSGPNGGEYLGAIPGATSVVVGTVSGIASTTLHSGTIPGTATIVATVEGTSLSSSSGVIAIGGGIPSEGHFSLSTEVFNLEGLAYDGITTQITALIADRYGNYNVLEGTAVSFYAECGAINRAINLDAEGEGAVTFRTQNPRPHNVDLNSLEDSFVASYASRLAVTINNDNNPRNGLCTIVAVVDGEEAFVDANGNGIYDLGETFVDTYDDIHLDKDDDPMDLEPWQVMANYPFDPTFEPLIVDRNGNGLFDGKNGMWDANKRIAKQIKLLMTGEPTMSIADGSGMPFNSLTVPSRGSSTINFSLHDLNHNPPVAGTEFKVSLKNIPTSAATLTGRTEFTSLDTSAPGAEIFSVAIFNNNSTHLPVIGELVFEWTWKGNDYVVRKRVEVLGVPYTITGTADTDGSISPPTREVIHGETTTFTVTANQGYTIASVTGCAGNLSGNIYTTGTITGACTVSATFNQNP